MLSFSIELRRHFTAYCCWLIRPLSGHRETNVLMAISLEKKNYSGCFIECVLVIIVRTVWFLCEWTKVNLLSLRLLHRQRKYREVDRSAFFLWALKFTQINELRFHENQAIIYILVYSSNQLWSTRSAAGLMPGYSITYHFWQHRFESHPLH